MSLVHQYLSQSITAAHYYRRYTVAVYWVTVRTSRNTTNRTVGNWGVPDIPNCTKRESAVECWAGCLKGELHPTKDRFLSCMKGELHPTKNRF